MEDESKVGNATAVQEKSMKSKLSENILANSAALLDNMTLNKNVN